MKRLTTQEFISKANQIHRGKYDYSDVNYIKSLSPVKIKCPIHGYFTQTPHEHLRTTGCTFCGKERGHKNKKYNTETFIRKAHQIHGNMYDYSSVNYKNNETKIPIKCFRHGIFYQTPNCHLQSQGCPRCRMSMGERKIINFLETRKIIYTYNQSFPDCINPKTNRKLFFDFYIPSKNLAIEFDGIQHFRPTSTKKYKITKYQVSKTKYRDKLKSDYTKSKGIHLLRIPYTKLKEINTILSTYVSSERH